MESTASWMILFISILSGIVIVVICSLKSIKKSVSNGVKSSIVDINRRLLEKGLTCSEIMEFWEGCMVEAEIQHNLPPCKCSDTSICDTWCRAKARFVMNPPED